MHSPDPAVRPFQPLLGTQSVRGVGIAPGVRRVNDPAAAVQDFPVYGADRVEPLVVDWLRASGAGLESCLDVGCGRNPVNGWFCKVAASPDARFVAADSDPDILAELAGRGLESIDPLATDPAPRCDLVVAKEVIEHLRPEDTSDFLAFCARSTIKVFALTTPNFEYWPKLRAADRELRFVPDHFPAFNPRSSNPHMHKQEMTPAGLQRDLEVAFPSPAWDVRVFRAWPWTLRDEARGRDFPVTFKIFALCFSRAAVSGGFAWQPARLLGS